MKDTWKSPNFYSLDRKGKIRLYSVRVEQSGEVSLLISSSGLLDGIQTDHSKWISKGKNIGQANATTPFEQARNEARSKCREKLDEGYKTWQRLIDRLTEIRKDQPVTESQESPVTVCTIFSLLDIKYNTNKDWDELPMFAKKEKEVKNKKWPYIEQPKLNGVRCMIKYVNGEVIMMSRGGKYYHHKHIKEALLPIFKGGFPNVILDGELYKHGVSLQNIVKCVKTEHRDAFYDDSWLEYHIYDLWSPDALDSPQKNRESLLLNLALTHGTTAESLCLHFVTNKMVYDMNEVMSWHDKWVEEGYEGAILRLPDAVYEPGFRPPSLIKIKQFIDEEFQIIGCQIDPQKTIGDSFVFVLETEEGKEFRARPIGTRELKEEYHDVMDDIRGKMATVRYQERTDDNIPHQAYVVVIRDYE